ncbi:MAG: PilZ domain-containing protein [Sedimenticola sp.]|nr:PilZ domain-containing protein [Sedimenticola sp.]
MNQQQDERREYFRIDDSLRLSYRDIDPDTLERRIDVLEKGQEGDFTVVSGLAAVTQEMAGTLHKIESAQREIAAYLKSIDRKIEILGRAFLARSSELFEQPVQSVNLSATGISFEVVSPLEVGTLLELRILLTPSYSGILCYAEVIACEADGEGERGGRYNLRTRFLYLKDADRDLLIQHVIQRQGEAIREARKKRELGQQ